MKKNLLFLAGLLTVMAFSFTACTDDDEEGGGGYQSDNKLVGVWINAESGDNLVCMEFKADGTVTRTNYIFTNHAYQSETTVKGTWNIPAKKMLNLTLESSYDVEYKLKNSNKTLVIDDGYSALELNKVEGTNAANDVGNIARMCGAWKQSEDLKAEFMFYYLDGKAYQVQITYQSDGVHIASANVDKGSWQWDSQNGVVHEVWGANNYYLEFVEASKNNLKQHDINTGYTYEYKRSDPLFVQNLIATYE